MKKRERHRLLQDLIQEKVVEKQEDFVKLLEDKGIEITQATISRDIKELHLVKTPLDSGGYRYSMPPDVHFDTTKKLGRLLSDAYISMDTMDYFLVMKTSPGNAQAVGALMDNSAFDGVIGSICGDDTMLLICRNPEMAQLMKEKLLSLI